MHHGNITTLHSPVGYSVVHLKVTGSHLVEGLNFLGFSKQLLKISFITTRVRALLHFTAPFQCMIPFIYHFIRQKYSLSEPSAPPTLVQGYNTSSTSIFVSWGVVPVLDQNGVILSYTVTYEALPPSPGSKLTKTVNALNPSITLEDLNNSQTTTSQSLRLL